ncbi:MAG: Gldg family protein, partial [Flavobacteriales bacterium]|nr:Gldg family protein [Flavobacteriales bacterium]
DFPAEIEKLKLGLKEKLTEFKAYAGDNFKFNFINLDEDLELSKKWKDELKESGIYKSEIVIKRDNKEEKIEIWPAIKLRMGEQTLPIQLLQPGRFPISQEIINIFNDQIEYNFVKALLKLNQPNQKRISFLKGHGELHELNIEEIKYRLSEFYDVDSVYIKQIRNEYFNKAIDLAELKYDSLISNNIDSISIGTHRINIFDKEDQPNQAVKRYIINYFHNTIIKTYKEDENKFSENIHSLNAIDLLVVARPRKSFTEGEKFILDQFIMNGGKVIWLIDMMDVNDKTLQDSSFTMTKPIEHGLQPFLFKYGARFNTNIICDSKCSPVYRRDKRGLIDNWFFYPVVSLNPINKFMLNVSPIKLRYASTVDVVGENNNEVTKLLEPSDNYKVMRNTRVNYLNTYNYDPSNFEPNENVNKPSFGWLIEGIFESNYKNRDLNENFKTLINNPNTNFKSESVETKMVFISDGDLIRNDFILSGENKGRPVLLSSEVSKFGTPDFYLKYGNATFFLNLVDELLGREELIPLRSKMSFPRLIKKEAYDNKYFWQLINILLPIIGVILFAFSYWTIRKRKYRN